jgi:hypothetical protein
MKKNLIIIASALITLAVAAPVRNASAYPQYQLSRGQTCVECHVSPTGGGLLTEQGLVTAETESKFGHAPEFMYGKWTPPSWLQLGGDFRALGGLKGVGGKLGPLVTPMQTDLYASLSHKNFTVFLQGGAKGGDPPNPTATQHLQSREHWVQWKQHEDDSYGLSIRAGKFMPTAGLRFVEHPLYVRRFGGSQLFSEAYGGAISYIQPEYEVHVTGYVKDFRTPVEPTSGAALYAEKRLGEHNAIGVLGRYATGVDDTKIHYGVTAKHYCDCRDLLFQAEVQGVHEKVTAGGSNNQIVGTAMATWMPAHAWMFDLALNYYDPNVHVKGLDRQAVDLAAHWFVDSHVEMLVTSRYQTLEFGSGGPSTVQLFLQAHFRL